MKQKVSFILKATINFRFQTDILKRVGDFSQQRHREHNMRLRWLVFDVYTCPTLINNRLFVVKRASVALCLLAVGTGWNAASARRTGPFRVRTMSRSYNDELQYLDKISGNCWRIKKGFVPNMQVRFWRQRG